MAAGLNFLPSVASRKYSPDDMIKVYQNAANGGRIGFNMGGGALSKNLNVFMRKGQMGYEQMPNKGVEPQSNDYNVLRDDFKSQIVLLWVVE
jgi:hypothetical protein